MDKTELKDILIAHHEDEIKDHESYMELSKEAHDMGYDCTAGILKDMANDEESHAEALAHILEKEVM